MRHRQFNASKSYEKYREVKRRAKTWPRTDVIIIHLHQEALSALHVITSEIFTKLCFEAGG